MTISSRHRCGTSRTGCFTLITGFALLLLCLAGPVLSADVHSGRTTLLINREYGAALLAGLREARSSIIVSCYLFKITKYPDNMPRRVADQLIRARQRGVSVTVILEQSRDESDFLNRENRATAAILSRNGIKVRFDSLRKTSHAKVVVIDDRFVFLGSHNLTHSALTRNNELSVRIDSPEMARQIKAYLGTL
ncbi:MAG: phospholipase D-like domain-containing protein [Geobacteraceae bacterium]|nr:phospholipase D-like domain-containing protein [Geobacteraceae bacterium]